MTVREHLQLAETKGSVAARRSCSSCCPSCSKCLDRKAGVLSGGEQQMLAVGRALVGAPRLLLVDEMSLGLAPVIVERLLPILRRVAEDIGARRAVRRAARLARARGRRPRVRAQPRTARARRRGRRPARPARPPALQLSRRSRRRDRLNQTNEERHEGHTELDGPPRRARRALLLAGCGCGGDDSSSIGEQGQRDAPRTATPDASAALGTENKASGDPITVGLLNLESGPVTFPEYRQAAEAAVKYINDYKGGIGGHPVKLERARPTASRRPPRAAPARSSTRSRRSILGGADIGAPGRVPGLRSAPSSP